MLFINLIGVYIFSGVFIYKFVETLDANELTNEQYEFLKLTGIIFEPVILGINYYKVQKAIYTRNKMIRKIRREIKKIDKQLLITTDKTLKAKLKADKLHKQMLLSYFIIGGDDNE